MTVTTTTEKVRVSKHQQTSSSSSGHSGRRRSHHSSSANSNNKKLDERESKAGHRSSHSKRRDRIAPDSVNTTGKLTASKTSSKDSYKKPPSSAFGGRRMVSRNGENGVVTTATNGAPAVDNNTTNNGSSEQHVGRRGSRRRSSKSKKQLKVNTSIAAAADGKSNNALTPQTEASTPSSSPTPGSVRNSSDLRSPGQRKTPVVAAKAKVAAENDPLPDFITQTDRFGNANTPRSEGAIREARVEHPGPKPKLHVDDDGQLTEDEEEDDEQQKGGDIDAVDACAETFYDSLRLVCCCLMPEVPSMREKSARDDKYADQQLDQVVDDNRPRLLPQLHPDDHGKKCLVLDLDETLVHSSFRAVPGADFVIPVQIEDVVHFVYVAKRPGVDEFLIEMAKHYEVVIYTASLNKYADPLLDLLDPHNTIRTRLFRESCVYYEGNYVKDLSLLDRDIQDVIIVDNSPSSYIFHPENAIDCTSFIDDIRDRELDQIGAFLTGIKDVRDVRHTCRRWREWPHVKLSDR